MPELKLENSIIDDRYRVVACLGRGSYAEIFLANDRLNDDATVIIKALNTTLQGTPDADLEWTLICNFQNEAIALDLVRHANVIRRLGHGTAADLQGTPFHYLVLEYMSGGDLLTFCRSRPLGLEDSLFYFDQVSRALANAHSHGVIHRDIKPNNLLLSGDHRLVKIADFGVAKMTLDDAAEITRVGTNVYAPPEHHPEGSGDEATDKLGPAADIYSLAKTVYTAMTARAPRQFVRQPIEELPQELSRMCWGPELLRVLNKATSSRVSERHQSVQEFWQDLERVAAQAELDPEATIVRSRTGSDTDIGEAAAGPQFQPLNSRVRSLHHDSAKARIVVELPHQEMIRSAPAVTEASMPQTGIQVAIEAQAPSVTAVGQAELYSPSEQTERSKHALYAGSSMSLSRVRRVITPEWLRRVFILCLVAALIGLAASTYYYFAGENVPIVGIVQGEPGSISGATNVNLRSDSNRQAEVLGVLPEGSRVRAFESKDGWRKVRVIEWAGGAPENAPQVGWVDGRFVRPD